MKKIINFLLGLIFLPMMFNQRDYIMTGFAVDSSGNPLAGAMIKPAEVYCNQDEECAMAVDLAYTPAAITDQYGYFEIDSTDFPRNESIGWVISWIVDRPIEIPVPCFFEYGINVDPVLALGWFETGQVNIDVGTVICPTAEEVGY